MTILTRRRAPFALARICLTAVHVSRRLHFLLAPSTQLGFFVPPHQEEKNAFRKRCIPLVKFHLTEASQTLAGTAELAEVRHGPTSSGGSRMADQQRHRAAGLKALAPSDMRRAKTWRVQ
jgi:hypothetical protein